MKLSEETMFRFANLIVKDINQRDLTVFDENDLHFTVNASQTTAKNGIDTNGRMALRVDTRRAPRFVPAQCTTSLLSKTGERYDDARIVNVSRYGVMIQADFSIVSPLDVSMIGSRQVDYVRRDHSGAAFEFALPLSFAQCNSMLLL